MRKLIVASCFLLVACGPGSCNPFGPSREELERERLAAQQEAEQRAIQLCNTHNVDVEKSNADQIKQQQDLIKLSIDQLQQSGSRDNVESRMNWGIEFAALDGNGWRWMEKTVGALASGGGKFGAHVTANYIVNPADLQTQVDVIPNDDGSAKIRFHCRVEGCIHVSTAINAVVIDPNAPTDMNGNPTTQSGASTNNNNVNSDEWLVSTRSKADVLKGVIEKLISLQQYKAPSCATPDGHPAPGVIVPNPMASSGNGVAT